MARLAPPCCVGVVAPLTATAGGAAGWVEAAELNSKVSRPNARLILVSNVQQFAISYGAETHPARRIPKVLHSGIFCSIIAYPHVSIEVRQGGERS
jgi:hypothetical protein